MVFFFSRLAGCNRARTKFGRAEVNWEHTRARSCWPQQLERGTAGLAKTSPFDLHVCAPTSLYTLPATYPPAPLRMCFSKNHFGETRERKGQEDRKNDSGMDCCTSPQYYCLSFHLRLSLSLIIPKIYRKQKSRPPLRPSLFSSYSPDRLNQEWGLSYTFSSPTITSVASATNPGGQHCAGAHEPSGGQRMRQSMSLADRVEVALPNSGWMVDEWIPFRWRTDGRQEGGRGRQFFERRSR